MTSLVFHIISPRPEHTRPLQMLFCCRERFKETNVVSSLDVWVKISNLSMDHISLVWDRALTLSHTHWRSGRLQKCQFYLFWRYIMGQILICQVEFYLCLSCTGVVWCTVSSFFLFSRSSSGELWITRIVFIDLRANKVFFEDEKCNFLDLVKFLLP